MGVASREVAAGRQVMVLVPNSKWICSVLQRYWRTPARIRASTIESSLKSLSIDTLILVGQSHADWNKKSEMYARDKVTVSSGAVFSYSISPRD